MIAHVFSAGMMLVLISPVSYTDRLDGRERCRLQGAWDMAYSCFREIIRMAPGCAHARKAEQRLKSGPLRKDAQASPLADTPLTAEEMQEMLDATEFLEAESENPYSEW